MQLFVAKNRILSRIAVLPILLFNIFRSSAVAVRMPAPRVTQTLTKASSGWCLVALMTGWFALSCESPAYAANTVRCPLAEAFDFPVGKPDARGYYKARGFYPNGHLGEDWNGNGGGDSDLGDPIYATARGVVVFSENIGVGWGNMIIIRHAFREADGRINMVDSLYGHMLERKVRAGEIVERGQLIATMGGNNGMYPVHLHFEIHKNLTMGPNRIGFAHDYSNYYSPTAFINAHRQMSAEYAKYDVPVDTFAPYGKGLTEEQVKVGQRLNIPVATGKPTGTTPKVATTEPATVTPSRKGLPTVHINNIKPSSSKPTSQSSPPPTAEAKSDFWSRLRSKLNNGQITGGLDDKKP